VSELLDLSFQMYAMQKGRIFFNLSFQKCVKTVYEHFDGSGCEDGASSRVR
jgi:hypothetical protein